MQEGLRKAGAPRTEVLRPGPSDALGSLRYCLLSPPSRELFIVAGGPDDRVLGFAHGEPGSPGGGSTARRAAAPPEPPPAPRPASRTFHDLFHRRKEPAE